MYVRVKKMQKLKNLYVSGRKKKMCEMFVVIARKNRNFLLPSADIFCLLMDWKVAVLQLNYRKFLVRVV